MSERIPGTRYLIRDSETMGGEPIVMGTRFPIAMVLVYCEKNEYTPETIVKDWGYPEEFLERFEEALQWGRTNRTSL